MTPSQVDLVQSSFMRVTSDPDGVAELFNGRLFELKPSLTPIFGGSVKQQGRMMMDTMRLVVVNLHDLDRIMAGVRALGVRHVVYGVRDQDYDTVGAALLWTLEQTLKDEFTPQVRQAWKAAYELLADTLKDASMPKAA